MIRLSFYNTAGQSNEWQSKGKMSLILIAMVSSADFLKSEPGELFCACVKGVGVGAHKVTAFSFWVGHVIYSLMWRDSMQNPLCPPAPKDAAAAHREQQMKASRWRPLDGTGQKRTRWPSLLIMCMLRASDEPASQGWMWERWEECSSRPAQPELQIRNWHTHWLIHIWGAHQKYITSCRQRLQTQTAAARTSTAPHRLSLLTLQPNSQCALIKKLWNKSVCGPNSSNDASSYTHSNTWSPKVHELSTI